MPLFPQRVTHPLFDAERAIHDDVYRPLAHDKARRVIGRWRRVRQSALATFGLCLLTAGSLEAFNSAPPCATSRDAAFARLEQVAAQQDTFFAMTGRYLAQADLDPLLSSSRTHRFAVVRSGDGLSYNAYALGHRRTAAKGELLTLESPQPESQRSRRVVVHATCRPQ